MMHSNTDTQQLATLNWVKPVLGFGGSLEVNLNSAEDRSFCVVSRMNEGIC